MKKLLEFVKETPTNEKPSHRIACPYCLNDKNIKREGITTTLVGGGSGIDDDPNHTWEPCTCRDCGKDFTRETRDGNVWYTDKDHKVLRGMPSCFEHYVYTCRECGGEVRRRYKELNSEKDPGCLTTTDDGPQYRIFFECNKCGKSIQTTNDYWYPGYKYRKPGKMGKKRKLRLGWKITEKIGRVIINDYAFSKVNIDDKK